MNNELLAVLEYMERERGIGREALIDAIESAMLTSAKKSMGSANDLRVEIDRKTLDIRAFAMQEVVDFVRDPDNQISLRKAQDIDPDVQVGQLIEVSMPAGSLGRIAAQTAKQAIMHRLRMAEKEKVHEEFQDRVGEIVYGTVRHFDRSDVVLDLGQTDAVIPSRERVPTEEYQVGERLQALVMKVDSGGRGADVVLTRSHPDFVRKLFELEVSELSDGVVEIKAIAREAGYRTKIAVASNDDKVDPVGACVGMRGLRVKNIVRELSGEKVDIVRWHDNIKTFVTNALAPAKLIKVDVDELTHCVHVTVDPDQQSLAIGKKGQNARLTAKLTGWKIDIRKVEDESRQKHGDVFVEQVALAVAQLGAIDGIGTEQAEKLVYSGFLNIEGILAAEIEDIEDVDGVDRSSALIIKRAAEAAYEKEHGSISE